MLIVKIELIGNQTTTHCSQTSSIGKCEKLNTNSETCSLFKNKLIYDFDKHAYRRCSRCMEADNDYQGSRVLSDEVDCSGTPFGTDSENKDSDLSYEDKVRYSRNAFGS